MVVKFFNFYLCVFGSDINRYFKGNIMHLKHKMGYFFFVPVTAYSWVPTNLLDYN